MRTESIRTLSFFFLLLVMMTNCGQQQEKEGQEKPLQQYRALNVTIHDTKQYLGQLDSALFELSVLENIPGRQDSAKRAIRSRDQDMVRIYEIEKEPIVDTASINLDRLVNNAQMVLEKSNLMAAEATRQIAHHIDEENANPLNSKAERIENRDAYIKEINRLVGKLKEQAEVLKNQLGAIDASSQ